MSKETRNLLITLDLELFLGSNSGSVNKSIIEPTKKLMKVLNKHKLYSVFFVDTLYLNRLVELKSQFEELENDLNSIYSLLRELLDTGLVEIFHHLHPHWLDAKYLSAQRGWDLSDKSRFSLNNFSENEIDELFKVSDSIIKNIYEGRKQPEVMGYRAGGLYAEPFSNLSKSLKKYNIGYDFSVLRGACSTEEFGSFDYSIHPSENIYSFKDQLTKKDDQGDFKEFSINQFEMFGWNKIKNSIYYRANIDKVSWKRIGDGGGSGNTITSVSTQTIIDKLKTQETYSIELLNQYKAGLYFKDFKKKKYIHMLSHPKLFSDESLLSFDVFLEKSIKKYDLRSNYLEME